MTMNEPVTRYAHVIALPVTGNPHPSSGIEPAAQQVAYHAARAYGFYLLLMDDDDASPRAALHALAHYELAALYWRAACSDTNDIDAWAVDIASDLDASHVIGPNLVTMLEWAGIDPAEIRPYVDAR